MDSLGTHHNGVADMYNWLNPLLFANNAFDVFQTFRNSHTHKHALEHKHKHEHKRLQREKGPKYRQTFY